VIASLRPITLESGADFIGQHGRYGQFDSFPSRHAQDVAMGLLKSFVQRLELFHVANFFQSVPQLGYG
jgi:hypothetical protein